MRAALWDGNDVTVVDDVDEPVAAPGQVVVAVDAAGVCGSDRSPVSGAIPQATPAVLGHEASGIIASVGPGVTTPAVGERVVLTTLTPCGTCRACGKGRPTTCRAAVLNAGPRLRWRGAPAHQFVGIGAFAEYAVVEAAQAVVVPNELAAADAALISCALVTGFGAVRNRAAVEPGEDVLVLGVGGVGAAVVHAAALAGARVVAVDRDPSVGPMAEALGAAELREHPDGARLAATLDGLEVDAAFECTGVPDLVDGAMRSLAWGGRAVLVGLPPVGTSLPFQPRMLYQDKALLGCRLGGVRPHVDIPTLAAEVLAGRIATAPFIGARRPLDAVPALLTGTEPELRSTGRVIVTPTT
ncbi:MAG: alcohol dehydrogenase catalytic domain-containing protein [Actinomycetota bacterium]|nr:alcohol dehydrogenase catalytic domain-containing protein [Actinomycetota bacterium]